MSDTDQSKGLAVDAGKKKQRRRKKVAATTKRSSGLTGLLPTDVVCTDRDLKRSQKSTECAVLLGLAVVCLYLFGFFELIQSMPEISSRLGRYHLGGNLNLARMEIDFGGIRIGNSSGGGDGDEGEGGSNNNNGGIPVGTWPVSVRGEDTEPMLHVGDLKTIMQVPKFWSPPVHNNEQFTREKAMQIGTCAEPDPVTGSFVRGDDCPELQRTIFIGIASYRDFQCRQTIETLFLRAENPERLRVGVVDQIVVGEDVACNEPIKPCEEDPGQALCKYQDRVDVYTMEAILSVGPVFARHLGYRLYRGEYYATQSDAHVSFTTNWDTDIILQLEATHNEMGVLSTYLTDVQGSIDPNGNSLRNTRPIMCNTYYEGGAQGLHLRHGSQPERRPSIHGTPQLQPWWAAGYSFSRGHFIVNVPYDYLQSMIFQGEEMSIGIRGFTVGYDFYAPERSVCFHHYATGKNAKVRNKVKHFWENGSKYAGTGKKAMQRLLGIVHMNPEVDPAEWEHIDIDRYGLGGVRTPEKFYRIFGIDVVKKKTQGHLCEFVMNGAHMHKMFTPKMRSDGMGIDYSQIEFEWVDPAPEDRRDGDETE